MKLKHHTNSTKKIMSLPRLNREEFDIIKKIALRLAAVMMVVLTVYFWGVAIISNIDSFWSAFSFLKKPRVENIRRELHPPLPPRLISIPVATRSATINIAGYAGEGQIIKLFANDVELQTIVAGQKGDFAFDNIPLAEGQNTFYAKAYDGLRQESKPSRTLRITYQEKPPSLTIAKPFTQQNFSQKESEITIEGKTDPEVSVKVNELQMVVDENGNFRALYSLQEGRNVLHFEVQDLAGNKTVKDLIVHFSRTF